MPRSVFARVLALSLLAAALPAAGTVTAVGAPLDHDWRLFSNDRFGLELRYPAAIFRPERATGSGDGNLFVSRDGRARLLIGAFANEDRHTPSSYQRLIARQSYPGYAIDYGPVGRGWTVLSGERGGTMFYEKVFFTCGGGVISSFAMMYPVAERALYDPIIERIENSFRAGREGCGREQG